MPGFATTQTTPCRCKNPISAQERAQALARKLIIPEFAELHPQIYAEALRAIAAVQGDCCRSRGHLIAA